MMIVTNLGMTILANEASMTIMGEQIYIMQRAVMPQMPLGLDCTASALRRDIVTPVYFVLFCKRLSREDCIEHTSVAPKPANAEVLGKVRIEPVPV